jgi:predicted O-methyltransferase YrrM
MLMMDSTSPSTRNAVMDILNGAPLDFLFIDGDHSLRACHTDYAYYIQMVRHGGVIAFHDAARFPGPQQMFQIVADHAAEKKLFVGPGELRGIGAIVKP